jgi:hypothetical protein
MAAAATNQATIQGNSMPNTETSAKTNADSPSDTGLKMLLIQSSIAPRVPPSAARTWVEVSGGGLVASGLESILNMVGQLTPNTGVFARAAILLCGRQ